MAIAVAGLTTSVNDRREYFVELIRRSVRRHLQCGPGEPAAVEKRQPVFRGK